MNRVLQRSVVVVVLCAALCAGCAGKKKAAPQLEDETGVPASVDTYERGMEYLTRSSLRQAKRELENVEYAPARIFADRSSRWPGSVWPT